MKHLIFFDDTCLFCQRCVGYIKRIDRRSQFEYTSLTGKRAGDILVGKYTHLQKLNTLILVENFKETRPRFWIRSKGVFRILWLIGSWHKLLGVLCFLPSFLIDPLYRLVARYRNH